MSITSVAAAFSILLSLTFPILSEAAQSVDRSLQAKLDAVKANPREPRNHYNLGVEYFNREMLDEAAKSFETALKTSKGDKAAHQEIDLDCYQILGHIALSRGKYGQALSYFQKGLKIRPDDPMSLFGRGQAYYLDRKFAASAKELKRYLAVTAGKDARARANAPQALTLLGAMALQRNNYQEAADYFRTVVRDYPKHSGDAANNLCLVLLRQGDEARKKGKLEEALAYYDEAVKAEPPAPASLKGALKSSAFAHYELGVKLEAAAEAAAKESARSHFETAEANFARASQLDKSDFESSFFEGLSQYYLERFDRMIESYLRTVSINPDHAEARYNLALAYYRKGLFEESIAEAEMAKKLQPRDPATAELASRIYDTAVEEYLKRGMEAFTSERLVEAIENWEKVLKLSPTNSDAAEYLPQARTRLAELLAEHIKKGDEAYDAQDLSGALREWNAALILDPANAEVKSRLAKVSKAKLVASKRAQAVESLDRQDYASALAHVEEALKLSPKDDPSLKLKRRIIRARDSGLSSIIAGIRKALASNDLKAARTHLSRARETNPGDKTVQSLAIRVNTRIDQWVSQKIAEGRAALGAGRKDAARKSFEDVLSLSPENAEAAKLVKQVTGVESSKAIDALKVKELNKKGINAYLLGRLSEAEKAWQEALAIEPDNTEIKRYLERVRLKLEGMKKAGGGGK